MHREFVAVRIGQHDGAVRTDLQPGGPEGDQSVDLQLQSRNSLTSGTHASTHLGGPFVGGLLVQLLGAVPTLLFDTASHLVSALLLRTLPERRAEAPDRRPPVREMIREGWRFVVHHPVMGPCMCAATAANTVCGAQHAFYALYLVREVHAAPGLVGLLLAADGVGTLIGAVLTNRITARLGTARRPAWQRRSR